MIYEYAIEPEALVELASNKLACRYIKDNFGEGQPRIFGIYPKKWIKKCFKASYQLDDNARKRMEVLFRHLEGYSVKRANSAYTRQVPWLTNAVNEHQRHNFKGILATSRITDLDDIFLLIDEIDNWQTLQPWQGARSMRVARSAHAMTMAVAPLLQIAQEIHFIDPHFSASTDRKFIQPFAAMLRVANNDVYKSEKNITYHVSCKWDYGTFKNYCEKNLPMNISSGMKVYFKRWRKKTRGEKLHDRFILTNIGGVSFSTGLDAGEEGETTGISLLDRDERLKIWDQYVRNDSSFELEKEFTITGAMK